MRYRLLACLLVLLAWPGVVAAQAPPDVNNPTGAQWTASLDHAAIDGYTLELLRPDGSVLQTIDAGKPTPDAQQVCRIALNVQPVAFGVGYSARVRARAGTATSEWAVSENKFNRVPGNPGGVRFEAQ